jgi:hypothetical protein
MRELNQVFGGYVASWPVHPYPGPVVYRPVVLATPPTPVPLYMAVVQYHQGCHGACLRVPSPPPVRRSRSRAAASHTTGPVLGVTTPSAGPSTPG